MQKLNQKKDAISESSGSKIGGTNQWRHQADITRGQSKVEVFHDKYAFRRDEVLFGSRAICEAPFIIT